VNLPSDPTAEWAEELIQRRQTILPRRLLDPGPGDGELARILGAAASAPDHDRLVPWRFVLVPRAGRAALASAFDDALLERDPLADPAQREQAREKAFRSPVLLLAIARLAGGDDPQAPARVGDEPREVPDAERILSAGCAIQNMLLVATALGYGSSLTSGKALGSAALRRLFALGPHEQALCFISFGTPDRSKPARERPCIGDYVSTLGEPQ
jgi:nitroreductase